MDVDQAIQPILSSLPDTGSQPIYNAAIDGKNPAVLLTTLFIAPLFNTTELGQLLIAATAHDTLVGDGNPR